MKKKLSSKLDVLSEWRLPDTGLIWTNCSQFDTTCSQYRS